MRLHVVLFIALAFLLNACGVGVENVDIPSERPKGKISGNVLGGLYLPGVVNVYTLADSEEREFIASSELKPNGEFLLEFAAESQLLLIEASQGAFVDPSSLQTISRDQNLTMSTVIKFNSGENHQTAITPVTHLASGLVLYEKALNQGVAKNEQLDKAQQMFKDLYSIDLLSSQFSMTYAKNSKSLSIKGDEKHGLLVNALSLLANELAIGKQDALKEQFNLASLNALMYEDIRADGMLNGLSLFADGSEKNLAYADNSLDFNFYRTDLAEAINKALEYSEFENFTEKSSQLDYLFSIANADNPLLADKSSEKLQNAKPEITLLSDVTQVQGGTFEVDFLVQNILALKQAKLMVDEVEVGQIDTPQETRFTVDTKQFSDGAHLLKLTAADNFGNPAELEFTVTFDNSAPDLIVTSPAISSESRFLLQGEFSESFSEFTKITVNDELADVGDNSQWSKQVDLALGLNEFLIVVEDQLGNMDTYNAQVVLDNLPPVLTYTDPIETAYSNNDGTFYSNTLELQNEAPLYFPSTKLSLNSMEETRENLLSAGMVFFNFVVNDQAINGLETAPKDLLVEYRYSIDESEMIPWTKKSTITEGNGYLFSLTTETLGSHWFKVTADQQHIIEIKVTDIAGNSIVQSVQFKAQFYVPDVNVNVTNELEAIDEADFSSRKNFMNTEVIVTNYNLHNDSAYPYRIRLSDDVLHAITHEYEEVKRENKVQLRATEVWQKSDVTALELECPSVLENWRSINKLWNTVNGVLVEVFPQTRDLEVVTVESDSISPPADTKWVAFKTDDQDMIDFSSNIGGERLKYSLDYLVDLDTIPLTAAYRQPGIITGWEFVTGNKNRPNKSCPDVYSIQTKTKYKYIPVEGYPRNVKQNKISNTYFTTSDFRVFDEDDSEIISDNGWFTIPLNHTVNIKKMVTTPDLAIYTDASVLAAESITDYDEHQLDKRLLWSIGQDIIVETQFNPDEVLTDDSNVKKQLILQPIKEIEFVRD